MSGAVDLVTELLKTVGIGISKLANWDQRKKDLYFEKSARHKVLSVRDRKFVNQEELLGLEDELKIFVKAYREELEK